jgi:formate dehydrogenase major subunit
VSLPVTPEPSLLPVELAINGQQVSARAGQTILEVVRAQGLDEIPTLCHDPRLEPYGSCFLCVVEVKGSARLLPACVTRVRDGMEVTTRSDRVIRARRTALELLLSDHYADCVCPGQLACPAGVDVQGYLSLARLGYFAEALALIRERNPLPLICGRVCVRKCEVQCRRSAVDEPVGINLVKHYVAEQGGHAAPAPDAPTGKRVAVVGGGPAGLSCANTLALRGHGVTVFEALPKLGGMLRYGIPEYRLPRAELDAEVGEILRLGVEVRTGVQLGRDFTLRDLREREGFDAVFLGVGAPRSKRLEVPGEEGVTGVESALDFLRRAELKGHDVLRGRVAVVGGGNSAIDAARTALRCGAETVVILYRRTRAEMPAHPEEVEAAEREGVRLELLVAPLAVLSEGGRLTGLRCVRMRLGEPDASGRRKPIPVPGSEFDYACDRLFTAIGQEGDPALFRGEPEGARPSMGRGGMLRVDAATLATPLPGVFAGGDAVSGPSVVIDAVAHGRAAAEVMDRYLRTGEIRPPAHPFVSRREAFGAIPASLFEEVPRCARQQVPERDPAERIRDFQPVELALGGPEVQGEASRCMACGCRAVFSCDLKRYATEYQVDIARFAGAVRRHRVDASHPLITLDPNKCILCGRCVRTCADLVGLAVLGFVGRGFATVVGPALGRPLAETACIACGACVETCPTGALEASLPCGRQGPWRTARTPSVCGFCSVGCRLDVHVVSDGLLWAASPQDEAGGGDLCRKGRFGTGLLSGSDRLRRPLVRREGRLEETDWDEALAEAARLLRARGAAEGPGALAVLAGQRMTLEESVLTRHLATAALGGAQIGSIGQHRRGGPRRELDSILGETTSTCGREALETAETILLVGADPSLTHPVLAMAIRRAAGRGAEIVAINSARPDLARPRDLWLDARRGTGGFILAGVIRWLFQCGLLSRRFLEGRRNGLEALYQSVADTALDEVAGLSGVEVSRLEALAGRLAGRRRIVALYDLDDTLERAPDDLAVLGQLLALTGHLTAPGEGLLLLRADCNGEGARLAGIAEPLRPAAIHGALVLGENPLGDAGAARALRELSALVVVDPVLSETARAAQVVLPAATLLESEGTLLSFDRRVHAVRPASPPPAGLDTLTILARLAQALGAPAPTLDRAALRAEVARRLGRDPAELEEARACGGVWPEARADAPIRFRALHLDTTATTANPYPYATLDGYVERRFAELQRARP